MTSSTDFPGLVEQHEIEESRKRDIRYRMKVSDTRVKDNIEQERAELDTWEMIQSSNDMNTDFNAVDPSQISDPVLRKIRTIQSVIETPFSYIKYPTQPHGHALKAPGRHAGFIEKYVDFLQKKMKERKMTEAEYEYLLEIPLNELFQEYNILFDLTTLAKGGYWFRSTEKRHSPTILIGETDEMSFQERCFFPHGVYVIGPEKYKRLLLARDFFHEIKTVDISQTKTPGAIQVTFQNDPCVYIVHTTNRTMPKGIEYESVGVDRFNRMRLDLYR